MAKHRYRIASEDGAARYGAAVDEEVELDLDVQAKRAVTAAGWVEQLDADEDEPKTSKKKEG